MSIMLDITNDANPDGLYYVHDDTQTVAHWAGGIYVDLGYVNDDGIYQALDVINVGYSDSRSGHGHDYTTAVLAVIVDEHVGRMIREECDGEGLHEDGTSCDGCELCD